MLFGAVLVGAVVGADVVELDGELKQRVFDVDSDLVGALVISDAL